MGSGWPTEADCSNQRLMLTGDVKSWRILEISEEGLFHRVAPEQTTWVWTTLRNIEKRKGDLKLKFSSRLARELLAKIAKGEFDLIVVFALKERLWRSDRFFLKNVSRLLKRFFWHFYTYAPYLILFIKGKSVPIVMIDQADSTITGAQNFIFFPKTTCFFKRELPQNSWNTFLHTSRRNEDLVNIQRQSKFQKALRQLRPFPLGVHRALEFSEIRPEQKTSDIFYIGNDSRSSVRQAGIKILERLRDQGLRVDISSQRLDVEEFRRRLSSSWLAWSPEGMGWECFRHHEAVICGTVPVINYPTIQRYRPFIQNRHALYYGCEGDDLSQVIHEALKEKARLLEMVAAARDHLQRGYTAEAVLRYIGEEIHKTPAGEEL